MKDGKIRIAIVGAGEMGILRSIIASAHPKFEVACFIDPSRIQARIAAKQLNVPYYTQWEKASVKEQFDMVFICSPVFSHEKIALQALENKKHVFCEKPLNGSLNGSKNMLQAAVAAGVVHFMGFDQRYLPTFKKIKELIDDNVLGNLIYIRGMAYNSEVVQTDGKREQADRLDRLGFYGSLGAHMLDLMLWYSGSLDFLFAQTSQQFSKNMDDYITVVCRFKNGMHGLVDFSWSLHGYDNKPEFSLLLSGANGTALVDRDHIELFCEREVAGYKAGATEIYASEIQQSTEFLLTQRGISWEMDAIAEAVLQNSNNYPSWQIGYNVDEFIEGIRLSVQTEKKVQFPITDV